MSLKITDPRRSVFTFDLTWIK